LIHAAYDILGLTKLSNGRSKRGQSLDNQRKVLLHPWPPALYTRFERGFIAAIIVDYDELSQLDQKPLPARQANAH